MFPVQQLPLRLVRNPEFLRMERAGKQPLSATLVFWGMTTAQWLTRKCLPCQPTAIPKKLSPGAPFPCVRRGGQGALWLLFSAAVSCALRALAAPSNNQKLGRIAASTSNFP